MTDRISNGTDLLAELESGPGTYADFRVQPNQLYTGSQVRFTGIGKICQLLSVAGLLTPTI